MKLDYLNNVGFHSTFMHSVFYSIYPKYGQVIFFEYMLQNTEPDPAVIVVDIAQSTLK